VYGPNEAQFPDPYGDPVANGAMDETEGHTGGNADYHYHALLELVFVDSDGDGVPDLLDDEAVPAPMGPSPILGYALDGFPIYGPRGCTDEECETVVTFSSSYETTNYEQGTEGCLNSAACNDSDAYVCAPTMIAGQETTACVYKDYAWDNHAYVEKNGEEWLDECNGRIGPDGNYRYHATSTFPYVLGCYHGVINVDHDACPSDNAGDDNGGGDAGPGGNAPPQAAQDACAGQSEGDGCVFTGRGGMDVMGTCATRGGVLACGP
ncbi:MAG: YHYH protein, partial [Myxococcota bacterium]|nr:YHYH protein [Myxococcota bacterium]